MNSPSRHGLHQLSTSERNRLAESALSAQEDSAILRAAVDFNGLRFRNHYASFQGHPMSALPQGFPSSPQPQGSTQAGLSMLALMRSNQAFAALRLANARSNPLFGLPPTNRALLLSTSNMGSGGLLKADPMAGMKMKSLPQAPPTIVTRPRETGGDIVRDRNEEALETLGATCLERRKQKSPYFDASALSDPDTVAVANRRTRGGVTEPFPEKLYRMLREAKLENKEDVISFFPHGRAFGIHKPERFAKEIMPKYFKQSRVSSFQRQLNLYGFTRINTGPDAGGYYHELFLRGRPALGAHIRRVGVPQAVPRRRGVKAHDATVDPDFYNMTAIIGAKQEEHLDTGGRASNSIKA